LNVLEGFFELFELRDNNSAAIAFAFVEVEVVLVVFFSRVEHI
jgi:hypothetical protein